MTKYVKEVAERRDYAPNRFRVCPAGEFRLGWGRKVHIGWAHFLEALQVQMQNISWGEKLRDTQPDFLTTCQHCRGSYLDRVRSRETLMREWSPHERPRTFVAVYLCYHKIVRYLEDLRSSCAFFDL